MTSFDAGKMVITRNNTDGESAHLLFTGGVRLIYTRQKDEE